MAKTQTILEVFIASPSDVSPERRLLEEVVSEFNLTWAGRHKVRLELVKWETHSRPSFGKDAQDVINRQVGDNYDIFLGIMWGRFGTATARAESGTEEEFARAYGRKLNGENVEIMFYFKDAGIPPSQSDGEQLLKIKAFRKQVEEFGGLYCMFETAEEFQTKARIHLSKVVQDWIDSNDVTSNSKSISTTCDVQTDDYNPLANLSSLDDSDGEEGVIDLVDRGTDALEEVAQIVKRMGEATTDLAHKFSQRTDETNAISNSGGTTDRKSAKRIVNNAANDLDVFVKRMSVEIPEFYGQNAIFTDSFSKIAMIAENGKSQNTEDIRSTLQSMQTHRTEIESSAKSLLEFRASLSDMPRTTTMFNQSRRRAVAILDDLFTQLRIAASQLVDIENLLLRIIKNDGDEASLQSTEPKQR